MAQRAFFRLSGVLHTRDFEEVDAMAARRRFVQDWFKENVCMPPTVVFVPVDAEKLAKVVEQVVTLV